MAHSSGRIASRGFLVSCLAHGIEARCNQTVRPRSTEPGPQLNWPEAQRPLNLYTGMEAYWRCLREGEDSEKLTERPSASS